MATIKAELTVRQDCLQAIFTSRLADPGQKYPEESSLHFFFNILFKLLEITDFVKNIE